MLAPHSRIKMPITLPAYLLREPSLPIPFITPSFSSQLQIIRIIILHILAHPQHHRAQHDQSIAHHIRHPHIHRLQRILLEQELQHHDCDTPRQPTSHQRKAQKQHRAGLPGDAVAAVAETVGREAGFFYAVDHEHAKRGADEGDPVDEGDVDGGAVEGGVREDAGVDEEEEAEGELWVCHPLSQICFLQLIE